MGKVTTFLREHVWCLLTGVGIILLGVITFAWAGQDNAIVNYVSFASAVVSITLGIIVIVYSFIQNNSFQQNIYEMRSLIHGIGEKTDVVDKGVKSVEQKIANIFQSPISEGEMKPVRKTLEVKFSEIFNLDGYSNMGIMLFYAMMVSYKQKKPFQAPAIAIRLSDNLLNDIGLTETISGFFGGIIMAMESIFSDSFVVINGKSGYEVKCLSEDFQKTVEAEIIKRRDLKNKKLSVDDAKKIIDEYFSQLQ